MFLSLLVTFKLLQISLFSLSILPRCWVEKTKKATTTCQLREHVRVGYIVMLCIFHHLNASVREGESKESSKQTWESTRVSSPKY